MILKCVTLLYFFCEAEQLPKLRFKLFFNQKEILWRSSLRFKLFLIERQFCGGARSASNFYLTERQFCGGARSASTFYLIERQFCGGARSASNFFLIKRKFCGGARSASNFFIRTRRSHRAELDPLHTFIGPINISTEKMLRFDNCPLLFLRISGKMIITNIFEPHSKGAAAFR